MAESRAIKVAATMALAGICRLKSTTECSSKAIKPATPQARRQICRWHSTRTRDRPLDVYTLMTPTVSKPKVTATSAAPMTPPQSASTLRYSLWARSG